MSIVNIFRCYVIYNKHALFIIRYIIDFSLTPFLVGDSHVTEFLFVLEGLWEMLKTRKSRYSLRKS